ncbi:cobalamin-binding protein [Oxalobacteraceae bacterium R-40]|uniref:Cobalamin-binding protein n=1 Tax=Keguizhuia sedimenti TaxID=3064264 RepID=A0ABU1BMS2_9BURK|nr:cobalamin-binding protein [Oxalobacteraceae bacterium R-40]
MLKHFQKCIALLLLTACTYATAAVSVVDDAGKQVSLPSPAKRIISLAPHITELLFAAGAGPYVVGVSQYSDFPAQARALPMVGGSNAFDIEKIISLKPDLAVVWRSGNSAERVAKLRSAGIAIFESEPRDFANIATNLEKLSRLSGTEQTGYAAADEFRKKLKELKLKYQHQPPVRVFYQIWRSPIMTLNGKHMVSEALRVCGGENVFGWLPSLAPTIGAEAVLEANPEVIIAANGGKIDMLSFWRRFPQLDAVRRDNLFTVDADWMNRAGPRILNGTELICSQLVQARKKRASVSQVNP